MPAPTGSKIIGLLSSLAVLQMRWQSLINLSSNLPRLMTTALAKLLIIIVIGPLGYHPKGTTRLSLKGTIKLSC